jgi:predicted ATPase
MVRSCAWQQVPWLARLQVRPSGGKPLAALRGNDLDATMAAIAKEVSSLVATGRKLDRVSDSLCVGRIRLKNVRGFRDFEIERRDAAGRSLQSTLVIGRNGTCKTTLLRAVALSLCDPIDAGSLIAEPIGTLVSDGADTAEIEVELTTRSGATSTFILRQEIWHADAKDSIRDLDSERPFPGPFVCAYGAGRYGVGTDTGRTYRSRDSVATLFDYRQTLIDSELTLRRLQDFLGTRRFDAALLGIKRVLGLTSDDEILLGKGGGVEVAGPSIGRGRVRLEGWADGYRLTFAWLLDLYGWAIRADRITPDGGIDGIVLLDEIEQHLHPSMQIEILPRLSEALPDLQIFATTHSPLVALGAASHELVSLRREGGAVVAEDFVPDFSAYSAEDMLVDERLFDSDAYGPETRRKLSRYQDLVKIPAAHRQPEQSQELRSLAAELRAQQVPEVRENAAAEELKRLVAKHGL